MESEKDVEQSRLSDIELKLKNSADLLEAIDRELAFYRRRAGQVFFLGLLVEVLILAGREKLEVVAPFPWIHPLVYGMLFIAVAATGIALGAEYRERIHILKKTRDKIVKILIKGHVYPKIGGFKLRCSSWGQIFVFDRLSICSRSR